MENKIFLRNDLEMLLTMLKQQKAEIERLINKVEDAIAEWKK